MKETGIGLQGRLKGMWRRYGARGFAWKCLVKALAILGVRVLFRWRGIMFTVFITGMCWPDTGEYFRGCVLEIYL